ncbi:MAG: hypothetical protein Q8918_09955 [Bacteroidota bacterium]|nr:hypothetical protein [Bacteroidota bacterium]MDP4250417.1 hypothetical protein [Bacteroidota bacterium]
MKLIEVRTPAEADLFIEINVYIHKNIPNYIRPLNKDIDQVFDPKLNKAFRYGNCTRWILLSEDNEKLGRIAAFVNKRYKSKGDDFPVGGIGFFDCVDNQVAADMLFDVAKHWLIQNGMEAMDGPINFGERDTWWGLVTEGFHEPMYRMNFNPPYYAALFESYGFRVFFHQLCFGMDPQKDLTGKVVQRHNKVAEDTALQARHIELKNLSKYAHDFTEIYNKAWSGHGGMKQLRFEQVNHMFKEMKAVIDPRLIWFVYHQETPIAMFVNIPDVNQWFKYLNGKFGLLDKLKFLWIKRTKPNKKFAGIAFGIVPEFQGKGVDAFLIVETGRLVRTTHYTEYEMQWIGDFNPKMVNLVRALGNNFQSRQLTTYRYIFDRTREFKRHPIL